MSAADHIHNEVRTVPESQAREVLDVVTELKAKRHRNAAARRAAALKTLAKVLREPRLTAVATLATMAPVGPVFALVDELRRMVLAARAVWRMSSGRRLHSALSDASGIRWSNFLFRLMRPRLSHA